jgi:pyrroline-5-carboxylate reductase
VYDSEAHSLQDRGVVVTEDTAFHGITLGFVGAGNMAEAITRGVLGAEIVPPQRIVAADPDDDRRAVFERFGCETATDNAEAARRADILILAVKPQMLDAVVRDLADAVGGETLVVSIAAGVPTARIEALLPDDARVVRVMPNTPMQVGRGVAAVAGGAKARAEDVSRVLRIFSAGGTAVQVADEDLLHAVTALSGSGPAYVFRFIEALEAAATELGLPEPLARAMAAGTVLGAAELLMESGETPTNLRERVTSPGGTTEAALASLARDDFAAVVKRAVRTAHERSRELGRG